MARPTDPTPQATSIVGDRPPVEAAQAPPQSRPLVWLIAAVGITLSLFQLYSAGFNRWACSTSARSIWPSSWCWLS